MGVFYMKLVLESREIKLGWQQMPTIPMKPAVINNSPLNQTPLYGTIQGAGDEGGDFIFIRR